MSTKGTDIATILGKGLVGAIPFVGPLAAEIVGAIIPNQRIDRLESLLQSLESKIPNDQQVKFAQKITSQESVDLIEDGFIQASRAISKERIDYISSLLKNSLTSDDLGHIELKRLLSILGELNDLEILILKSHTLYRGESEHQVFWEKHEKALTAPIASLGSSKENIDKHILFQTHGIHLTNIGLLRQKFKKTKKGEFPEFDERTGMMKSQGYEITPLGRLLLRSIDQYNE